jgi:hypothetical protein
MNRTQRPNLTSRPARTDGPRNFAGTSLRKFLPILALPFAIAVQAEPAFYQAIRTDGPLANAAKKP